MKIIRIGLLEDLSVECPFCGIKIYRFDWKNEMACCKCGVSINLDLVIESWRFHSKKLTPTEIKEFCYSSRGSMK